ncbi:MAG: 7-cyano-7-deazaguanine synthase QueC [candidate division Zixibacteria bacterium]|nr:7-cyano-7-deazaguanine synthase QueC [candidate division Zixibacteria bacterium]
MTKNTEKKAVILLSGGIDSYTTAAIALKDKFQIYAISFDYGQRHKYELKSAKKVAGSLEIKNHLTIKLDLRQVGGSALTDNIEVPKNQPLENIGNEIPVTYVPARNTIFLSIALGYAETVGANHIFIGANAVDYSGYPDCRPKYLEAFEKMANLATKATVEGSQINISAPLLNMSKSEIIQKGQKLGLDYSLTISCYDPPENGQACGNCESCLLRQKGFKEAGIEDPTNYFNTPEKN